MSNEASNDRVIKSYVWHGDDCFFISTIERASSAAAYDAPRYNETLVWEYDWVKAERGKILHQDEDARGCISTHQRVCLAFFNYGKIPETQNV